MNLMFKYFFQAVKNNKKYFFISLIILLCICIINIAIPFLLHIFLNNISEEIKIFYLSTGILCFLLLYLFTILLDILWNISLDKFAGNYIHSLLKTCQIKLTTTYMENIDTLRPNIIKSILFGDILDVFRIVGRSIPVIISSVLIIIGVSTISLIMDFKTTLFILSSILFGVILAFLSQKKLDRVGEKTNQSIKALNSINIEFVDMISMIQVNDLTEYYNSKTRKMVNNFITSAINEDKKIYFWNGLVTNYNSLFSLILSIILSLPLANNSLTNMAFFILLSNILIQYSQKLELIIQQIMHSRICFKNLENIINLPQRNGTQKIEKIDNIFFDKVSFSYPETEKLIFKDFSFRLEKGDCLKIEGQNGSGKTTFVKLLTNLYSVHSGKIYYNDIDIKDFLPRALIQKVLYINQEETFINESIEDYFNILTKNNFNQNTSLNLYKELLDLEFNKTIANNGANLSVGQRKKILILKFLSLYQNADLIILDEIFAGLDLKTKDFFTKKLNEIIAKEQKIFIFISHEDCNIKYNKVLSL